MKKKNLKKLYNIKYNMIIKQMKIVHKITQIPVLIHEYNKNTLHGQYNTFLYINE